MKRSYIVIEETSIQDLVIQVEAYLANDFMLYGDLIVTPETSEAVRGYYQVLVKNEL